MHTAQRSPYSATVSVAPSAVVTVARYCNDRSPSPMRVAQRSQSRTSMWLPFLATLLCAKHVAPILTHILLRVKSYCLSHGSAGYLRRTRPTRLRRRGLRRRVTMREAQPMAARLLRGAVTCRGWASASCVPRLLSLQCVSWSERPPAHAVCCKTQTGRCCFGKPKGSVAHYLADKGAVGKVPCAHKTRCERAVHERTGPKTRSRAPWPQ